MIDMKSAAQRALTALSYVKINGRLPSYLYDIVSDAMSNLELALLNENPPTTEKLVDYIKNSSLPLHPRKNQE